MLAQEGMLLKTYHIHLGKERIGQAHVRREGLYYSFLCCCTLQTQTIYRVTVSVGGHRENLGILVPEGNRHILSKKIPIKRFPDGEMHFEITPRHEKIEGKFVIGNTCRFEYQKNHAFFHTPIKELEG